MTIDAKIRALLAKTVKAGATAHEQIAATELARKLVAKHGLKEGDFTWPAPPAQPQVRKAAKAPPHARKATKPGKGSTRTAKRPTRADEVVELLRRKNGATIEEMVKRFGIQPHSIRAIISVESRKRGLKVEMLGKAHYRII
jgi:hypothetical protein